MQKKMCMPLKDTFIQENRKTFLHRYTLTAAEFTFILTIQIQKIQSSIDAVWQRCHKNGQV